MLNLFINTWGNYNENGADGGEWITLPMTADELTEVLKNIADKMGDPDPEWAIHDFEWETEIDFGEVHEMDSLTEWNEILNDADGLSEYDAEEVAAIMEAFGYNLREAIERQQRGDFTFYAGMDLEDVAETLIDECYNTPEIFTRYFDYEAFARDLSIDGYTETKWGTICAY